MTWRLTPPWLSMGKLGCCVALGMARLLPLCVCCVCCSVALDLMFQFQVHYGSSCLQYVGVGFKVFNTTLPSTEHANSINETTQQVLRPGKCPWIPSTNSTSSQSNGCPDRGARRCFPSSCHCHGAAQDASLPTYMRLVGILEQPCSSLMMHHPRALHMPKFYELLKLNQWLGAYNHWSPKLCTFYSNKTLHGNYTHVQTSET